jgi:hypothetical protein
MPFERSPAGGGEGVELARGYISLTAKYSPAMQQIAKDFRVLEDEAAKSGVQAGKNISRGVAAGTSGTGGLNYHMRRAAADMGKTFESNAEMWGATIGNAVGRGIRAPFALAGRAVRGIGDEMSGLLTGPMARMIGATTVIGGAFETFKKGWEIDSEIQSANTQLKIFGATTQDITDYWDAVKESIQGTSISLVSASEVAKDLFSQGKRGNALKEELENIENIATGLNQPIEKVFQLLEKGVGRGQINSMVLGGLGMQGIPARQMLEKNFGLQVGTPEADAQLDKLIKSKNITGSELIEILGGQLKGAPQQQAQTLSGQMSRIGKGIGGIGAGLMGPLFGGTAGESGPFGKLAQFMDRVNDPKSDTQKRLGQVGGDIAKGAGDIGSIVTTLMKTVGSVIFGKDSGKGIDFDSIQHGFDNVQHAMDNFRHAMDNVQHAGDNVHHALENVWHAAENVWHALENVWHAGENVWHALDNIWNAGKKVDEFLLNFPSMMGKAIEGIGGKIASGISGIFSGIHLPSWLGGHADGGIVSHKDGYIPENATIQKPVGKHGLIQWAEPSTHGEAYIPLAMSKRQRSLSIWAETGKRLGAFGRKLKHLIGPMDNGGMLGPAGDPWMPFGGWGEVGYGDLGTEGKQNPWLGQHWPSSTKLGTAGNPWLPEGGWGEPGYGNGMPWLGQHYPLGTKMGITGKFDNGGVTGGDSGEGGIGPNLVAPPTPGGLAAVSGLLQTLTGMGGGSRTPYQLGGFSSAGIDCSGLVSAIVNAYLGQSPFGSRMDTHSEQSWLTARGFREGIGPPGSMQVGWSSEHTAMSVGGENMESTTSHGISGVRAGKDAASPLSSQFTNHMWLPVDGALPVDISKVGGNKLGTAGGGGGGGGDDPISSLMGIAKGGAKESFLPPGFIDYTQNPWFKSAGAAAKMLMGGDGLSGLIPKGFGDALMHPVRAAEQQLDPARAAQLGWGGKPVNPGESMPGSLARGATGLPAGAPVPGLAGGLGGGGNVIINGGAMIDRGTADRINGAMADTALAKDRGPGPGGQQTTMRMTTTAG